MVLGKLPVPGRPTNLDYAGQAGRVAQSVGHLFHKSEALNSIPGLVYILSFLLPLIQVKQLSVTGESICTKYWLTA